MKLKDQETTDLLYAIWFKQGWSVKAIAERDSETSIYVEACLRRFMRGDRVIPLDKDDAQRD